LKPLPEKIKSIMGLDSVELVMEVEKYFNIQIPDHEAEKAIKVGDLVDVVAGQLSIKSTDTGLLNSMVEKIQDVLLKLNLINKPLALTDPVFTVLIPFQKEKWKQFEEQMGLVIPKPSVKPVSTMGKIVGILWSPLYDANEITLEHFASAIFAKNCKKFVNPAAITNRYEIYIAIMNITVDKIGVDEYEITPEKSFTDDLGVD
jgi:acyl carrier protein